ncbi:MAG: acyl-CoA synthetase FdrA [Anaerolineae bacterium]|nr:acyl-CoA synthetase FdrA [Anaerolineae bacterium]
MPVQCTIKPGEYRDSVALMEISRQVSQYPGVSDSAVVMATRANQAILREAGLLTPEIERADANDLVVVVQAESADAVRRALEAAEGYLARQAKPTETGMSFRPRTIRGAVGTFPGANMALISVAGRYAALEAWEALRCGLHVLLFSDNVSIEEEVALKRYAVERGLLMMGADCGTAIINGVALGFANAVPRGPIGIAAASGTGLQEVSTLLAKMGLGISQAIGTGGRDLKELVGGITMLEGVGALESDPETRVLVLISKPPAPAVARCVLERVSAVGKPTVVCFLGGDPAPIASAGAIPARTLQEAAHLAAATVGGSLAGDVITRERADLEALAAELKGRLWLGQRFLRGLYSGGTLASEALVIWQDLGIDVLSNVALEPRRTLRDATRSEGHSAIDLGDDEFTVGRPHPMIDHSLRIRRLHQEAADPEVAVVVLDLVLGYGAHPSPAGELGPAVREARAHAHDAGRELIVIASVTGTEEDPQVLSRQVQKLEVSGAIVVSCNAAAAWLAGRIVA